IHVVRGACGRRVADARAGEREQKGREADEGLLYEECHFQTSTKNVKAARGASSPTETDMAPRSHLRLLLLRLFDDLVARHDLDAGPERRGDAAILRLREFDCRGHGLLRDLVAADDVAHLHAR